MSKPQNPLPESSRILWLRVGSDQITRVHVLSRVNWWFGHWSVALGAKVRCTGLNCSYCNSGAKQTVYYVVGVFHHRHGRMLLELRDRHRPIIEELHAHETGGVGTWLHISRRGVAQNAPIDIEIARWEQAQEWDITGLVESIGASSQRNENLSNEAQNTACL